MTFLGQENTYWVDLKRVMDEYYLKDAADLRNAINGDLAWYRMESSAATITRLNAQLARIRYILNEDAP